MMILKVALGSEVASQQQRDQVLKWGPKQHQLCPDPTTQVSEQPDVQIVNGCGS